MSAKNVILTKNISNETNANPKHQSSLGDFSQYLIKIVITALFSFSFTVLNSTPAKATTNPKCSQLFESKTVATVPISKKEDALKKSTQTSQKEFVENYYKSINQFTREVLESYEIFVDLYFQYKVKNQGGLKSMFFHPLQPDQPISVADIGELSLGELHNINSDFFERPEIKTNLYFQLFKSYLTEVESIAKKINAQSNSLRISDNDILQRIPTFYMTSPHNTQFSRSVDKMSDFEFDLYSQIAEPLYGKALALAKITFAETGQNYGYFKSKSLENYFAQANKFHNLVEKNYQNLIDKAQD